MLLRAVSFLLAQRRTKLDKINGCKMKRILGQSASPSAGAAAPVAQGGNAGDFIGAPSVLL